MIKWLKLSKKSIIINCAGKKKSSSGFPGDFTNFINSKIQLISIKPKKLINWHGYLSIEKNKTTIKKTFISINKKDGLNEIWTCDLNKITKEKYKFKEGLYTPKKQCLSKFNKCPCYQ